MISQLIIIKKTNELKLQVFLLQKNLPCFRCKIDSFSLKKKRRRQMRLLKKCLFVSNKVLAIA